MTRNMLKTVDSIKGKGIIPDRYDLTAPEMQTLYDMFHRDPFEAISTTFDYGFVLGARAQKAGKLDRSASNEKMAYVELINKAMKECNDISTLDLVWKILTKSECTTK